MVVEEGRLVHELLVPWNEEEHGVVWKIVLSAQNVLISWQLAMLAAGTGSRQRAHRDSVDENSRKTCGRPNLEIVNKRGNDQGMAQPNKEIDRK